MSKTRWVNVEVTEEMIREAVPGDCYGCLVALALRKATGFHWHVTNDSARIEVLCGPLGKLRPTWKLPRDVRELILRFDNRVGRRRVKPCTFRLPARYASDVWRQYGAEL